MDTLESLLNTPAVLATASDYLAGGILIAAAGIGGSIIAAGYTIYRDMKSVGKNVHSYRSITHSHDEAYRDEDEYND